MTYFGVLWQFIGPPLVILAVIAVYDLARGKRMPSHYRTWPAWAVFVGHIAIALVYTTPWDNYLVATRVWWYEPSLVTGITWGWVPIEEYTFFVVQTMVAGLWLMAVIRRLRAPERLCVQRSALRWSTTAIGAIMWSRVPTLSPSCQALIFSKYAHLMSNGSHVHIRQFQAVLWKKTGFLLRALAQLDESSM